MKISEKQKDNSQDGGEHLATPPYLPKPYHNERASSTSDTRRRGGLSAGHILGLAVTLMAVLLIFSFVRPTAGALFVVLTTAVWLHYCAASVIAAFFRPAAKAPVRAERAAPRLPARAARAPTPEPFDF